MRDFHLPGRSPVIAVNGMCAASHPLASKVAIDILEKGGNAVDAAIAAAVLLGICEPQMTGIGGDCFVLVKPAGCEDIIALNGSGRSSSGLDPVALRAAGHREMPNAGVHSITVPGAIDAFCTLSEDWGNLGLAASLAPAIRYAKEGVPIAPRTAFDWARCADRLSGRAREYYLLDGKPPEPGQLFSAPKQADVLRRVAREGRSGFYDGVVASDMVASLNALGGCHTLDDFAAMQSTYTKPISGSYKGWDLVEHPPNGQGATAILMANILACFDLQALDPFGATRAHIEAEAAKLAYDARNRFIADPGRTTRLEHMLSPTTAQSLAALINPERAMTQPDRISEQVHKDTICLSVVDRDRMAVSLIYSIYQGFGSGLASDRFGILFQNRGAGFTLQPGHPNEAGPAKRPMHTIIPAMLKRGGKVVVPFGVMGGAYQPNGHARFLTNLVDFGMDLQCAIDGARSFSDSGIMKVERGYPNAVRGDLARLGHRVEIPETPIGGAQAIWIGEETGTLMGASDPRKDGCALGY